MPPRTRRRPALDDRRPDAWLKPWFAGGFVTHTDPTWRSGRVTGPGEKPRHPTDHMATTASTSSSTVAPLAWGSPSEPSATAWASLAYSFLERPDSISSEATTTSVFQCR